MLSRKSLSSAPGSHLHELHRILLFVQTAKAFSTLQLVQLASQDASGGGGGNGPPHGASYLTRWGVFTQQGFVVSGEDGRVVVDVQHRHQRDALPNLDRILWKGEEERLFTSQVRTSSFRRLRNREPGQD